MRIALVDYGDDGRWPRRPNRFAGLALQLERLGHEARLVVVSRATPGPTIVAGAERERDMAPLIASARALEALAEPTDLVVLPLRGGIAHGVLMARACGELAYPLKVALWCDGASRPAFLEGDFSADESLAVFVADAMERVCLELADHLVASRQELVDMAASLGVRTPPVALVAASHDTSRAQPVCSAPARLAFVGPLAQRCGLFAFVEAVERMWKDNRLALDEVAFVTRSGDPLSGEGARWIDLRTRRWDFPHRVVEARSDAEAATFLADGRLPVVCREDETERPDWLPADSVVVPLGGPSQSWSLRVERALAERVAGRIQPRGEADWAGAIAEIAAPGPAPEPAPLPRVTVCVLHFDRPRLLETALASFAAEARDHDVELIIVDNASRLPESAALMDRLERDGVARVLRRERSQPLPEAYNHSIRAARGDYIVFLDDDNMFIADGLTRLRRACASGAFDVVVSNLDMFDDDGAGPLAGPRLAFIGQARSAGLFFNAFGDTCMAFRREALQDLGGYLECGAPYPSPDWLLLARAQAAGLRIGVLQQPAYRYRRRPLDAAPVWQKFDRRSPRRLALSHFGAAYDAAMLARLAQGALLDM